MLMQRYSKTCSASPTGLMRLNTFKCPFGGWSGRWRTVHVLAAKKGGDKKGSGEKKGQKKSALAELMKKKEAAASSEQSTQSQYDTPEARMLAFQMCDSHWRLTKKYLLDGVDSHRLASELFHAPFALLAHNRFQEGVTNPSFTYGNRAVLELFETTWSELLLTPSLQLAGEDPEAQKVGNELLDKAAKTGLMLGVEMWQVSKSGRHFKIKDGTLFNIMGREGTKVGQAVVFQRYILEDGREVTITASPREVDEAEAGEPGLPSPETMQAAEQAVAEQAAIVRSLKEQKGLTNQDIPVKLAVDELKKRKERVAALQKQLEEALVASEAMFDDEDDE